MTEKIKSIVSALIGGYTAPAAFVIALAALGYQTYRAEVLERDLKLSGIEAERYKEIASGGYEVLGRLKNDFNISLNACYKDIKDISDRFDRYREAAAGAEAKTPVRGDRADQPKTAVCAVGGKNPLIDALNNLNQKKGKDETESARP